MRSASTCRPSELARATGWAARRTWRASSASAARRCARRCAALERAPHPRVEGAGRRDLRRRDARAGDRAERERRRWPACSRRDSIDFDELIETRLLLEVPLAGLAAQRADDGGRRGAARRCSRRLASAQLGRPGPGRGDRHAPAPPDRRHRGQPAGRGVHRLDRGRCSSRALREMIEPAVVEPVIAEQHRDIVRAIERGDPSAAERAMREHLVYLDDLDVVRRGPARRRRERALRPAASRPPRLREAVSARAWVAAMLEAEAALAAAEAEAGVIPAAAAAAIARRAGGIDPAALGEAARRRRATRSSRSSRRSATASAREHAERRAPRRDEPGRRRHRGDARRAPRAGARRRGARRRRARLRGARARARRHAMAGRTLLQQALPITFGLKAAGWLDATLDARAGLLRARARRAARRRRPARSPRSATPARRSRRLRRRLGLGAPALPWHTARGRVAELGAALAVAAGTMGKLGARPRAARADRGRRGRRRRGRRRRRCRTSATRSAPSAPARARCGCRRSPRSCWARWRRSTSAPPAPGTRSGSRWARRSA